MRKLKIFFTITTFSALSFGITAEVYQVQRKDSLIKIIRNRFPDLKVFGKKGILKEVLALNPSIKNPNLIYAGETLKIPVNTPPAALPKPNNTDRDAFDQDEFDAEFDTDDGFQNAVFTPDPDDPFDDDPVFT